MRGTCADSIDPDRIDPQLYEELNVTLEIVESGVVERVAVSMSLTGRQLRRPDTCFSASVHWFLIDNATKEEGAAIK